jgi:predicted nuclease of predicted toxin-antitoxin system
MFLLLDENIAACAAAGGTLYTAQRSVEIRALGRGASDPDIYDFARQHNAVLVTQNRDDFAALAIRHGPVPVIVLPSVAPRMQHAMLRHVVPIAEAVFASDADRFVEVFSDGRVESFRVQRAARRRRPANPRPDG